MDLRDLSEQVCSRFNMRSIFLNLAFMVKFFFTILFVKTQQLGVYFSLAFLQNFFFLFPEQAKWRRRKCTNRWRHLRLGWIVFYGKAWEGGQKRYWRSAGIWTIRRGRIGLVFLFHIRKLMEFLVFFY